MREEKLIEVCDKCKRACCWYGEFMCDLSQNAGTIWLPIKELRKLGLEDESYWSDKKLEEVYGTSNPNQQNMKISREKGEIYKVKSFSKPMQPKEEWVIDFQNKFSTIRILEAGKDKLGNWDVVRSGNEEIIKFISTLLQEQHRKTIEESISEAEKIQFEIYDPFRRSVILLEEYLTRLKSKLNK